MNTSAAAINIFSLQIKKETLNHLKTLELEKKKQ